MEVSSIKTLACDLLWHVESAHIRRSVSKHPNALLWQEKALMASVLCRYSPDGIKAGLSALKGDDRAAAAVLHEAEEYGLNVCIATFNIMQAGWGDTEDDLEVINAEYDLTGFTTLNGTPKFCKSLHVNINDEVIPVSC